jgi:hypothetical protein
MPRLTTGTIRERRALNYLDLFLKLAPPEIFRPPHEYLRILRGALRMSQAQLSRRCGIPQSHIVAVESGRDVRVGTLKILFDALFCDLVVVPRPRKRPTEAIGELYPERPGRDRPWG